MGFSTIGTGTGGGGGSAQQVNFSVTASVSQTVSALYISNSIVDVAGLLVAIQNTAATPITLTAASGSITNYQSYPVNATATTVVIQPNATVVLETNLANLNYFINSYSNITNVLGGSAGQLVYQSAANTTSFVPTGTAGYMLQSNGTSIPTWAPVAVPNVQGGDAGQILYQTAVGATGFVAPGTSGQLLISNGTAAPSWASISGSNGVTVNNTGSSITLTGTRSYTFNCSGMTSGQSFTDFCIAGGIPNQDGNQYTVYNNTSSTFSLVLPVIGNTQSFNYGAQIGNFINGSTVGLLPNQSINFQRYSSVNDSYFIMDTTNTQQWGFVAQVGSMGSQPATTDTLMNFDATYDPTNNFNNTTHAFTIPKTGVWIFNAMTGYGANGTSYTSNIQLRKNGTQFAITFGGNGTGSTANQVTMQVSAGQFCNVGDVITVTNWISIAGTTTLTGNGTVFSGILGR